MKRFAFVVALFAAFGLVVGACSDDDDSSTPEATGPPTEDAGDSDDDAGGVAGTATVEVAGATYEFTEAETCEIGAPGTADALSNPEARTANIMFGTFGDDLVVFDVEEHTTSVYATLNGETWRAAHGAGEFDVTDDGVVFSGEMTSGSQEGPGDGTGSLEVMTVSISCS